MAGQRFVEVDPALMTDEQRRVVEAITSGPRGFVAEPYRLLLHSPELADRVQTLGAYVRYRSVLPPRLSELAILVTARTWDNRFEWYHHVRDALAGGVPRAEIEAIARRERPQFDDAKASVVYDFCRELLDDKSVGDETFARAIDALDIAGVVDLIGILGHYALLANLMNAFEVPPPGEAEIPLAD